MQLLQAINSDGEYLSAGLQHRPMLFQDSLVFAVYLFLPRAQWFGKTVFLPLVLMFLIVLIQKCLPLKVFIVSEQLVKLRKVFKIILFLRNFVYLELSIFGHNILSLLLSLLLFESGNYFFY